MDQIIASLKSPGWWFTACFVGILASVLAGYLKDGFQLFLSRFSRRMRKRRWKRLRFDALQILAIKRHGELLTAYGIKLLLQLMVTALYGLAGFCVPSVFRHFSPNAPFPPIHETILGFSQLFLLVLVMWQTYTLTSRLDVFYKGYLAVYQNAIRRRQKNK
jgi:hypothetical protein